MRYPCIFKTIISISLLIVLVSFVPFESKKIKFYIPKGWPEPNYKFSKFPLTEAGFQLGRKLFYDPMLSRDGTISCASCHNSTTGFTHSDHSHSHGIEGRIGTRNSPSLINLAWNKYFMWDGSVNHIEVQAIVPITNKLEMDETLAHVVKKVNSSSLYQNMFYLAYGDSLITGQKLLLSLTQFVIQLNSSNSKYDKYIRKESGGSFSESEKNGLLLFRKHCASCHTEPLFTSGEFENNGLPMDQMINDYGRMKVTQNIDDSLKFKVPTLRNIQYTAPYMHDGRFANLSQVMNHYTTGILNSRTLSSKLSQAIRLNSEEKKDLVAFLLTLTDNDYLQNLRFSFPKETK